MKCTLNQELTKHAYVLICRDPLQTILFLIDLVGNNLDALMFKALVQYRVCIKHQRKSKSFF